MVKIGDNFFISSVEVVKAPSKVPSTALNDDRTAGEGVGHLFKLAHDGTLIGDVRLGEGSMYHPGGIDFDGRSIWVPVSEYRPHSRAIIYAVDPGTMKAREMLRFADHLGAVAYDRQSHQLHAANWGSRKIYAWPPRVLHRGSGARGALTPTVLSNPNQYIDYQDCHAVPGHQMLCAGLADYPALKGERFELGGVDLIDLKTGAPVWQIPVELRAPSGRLMTQNPFFVEDAPFGLRAYFMPDDDRSTIFVFDITL